MLGDIRQARNIYIVCGYTDMRKGLNSLVPFIQQSFKIDPYSRQPVSLLRQALRPAEGPFVGTGWLRAAVQAAGQWPIPMAPERPGGQAIDLGAIHLAHAGAEH